MEKMSLPTKWNLGVLYKGDDDPKIQEDLGKTEELSREFVKRWKDRPEYLEDPKVLREALDDIESSGRDQGIDGRLSYYFGLRLAQDQNNPELRAKVHKIEEVLKRLANESRFFHLNLAKVSEERQQDFLNAPELQKYKHYLEGVFEGAKHNLSEKEESILTLLSGPAFGNWERMTDTFVSEQEREVITEDGGKKLLPFNAVMGLLSSKNKDVRDSAFSAINEILQQFAEVAENEMNSILETKKVNDELRGYLRPDSARHLGDDIDTVVVDALVEAVSDRFDIPTRYYELKSKLLGVSKLKYHERTVEYGEIKGDFTYEESVKLVQKVMDELDSEFGAIFKMFVENGQIDVFPEKGKSGGAFCTHNSLELPTYILLNHNDKLRDVTTIAHELGHGINNELIRAKQHELYFDTPMSTAEVASTFMEDFVLDEFAKSVDDEQLLAINMMKLDDAIATIFRQIAAYKFEQELHSTYRERGYLSREDIGSLFKKHMKSYMGEFVEQASGTENWWVYWGHFRAFFYVYSYSSGLLISKSLQSSVKKDRKFIKKVKEFLAAGTSDSPKNIFSNLGIDITDKEFWEQGIREVEELLTDTEGLARKLGKI
jgi:oligoendopeptidase F